MTTIGQVKSIWRYPVKSMMGEELQLCDLNSMGLPGDRGWALRDDVQVRGAKKFPILMQCRAEYLSEPTEDKIPEVRFEFPDGSTTSSQDENIHGKLSDVVGKKVRIYPRQPAEDLEYYRRKEKINAESSRELFGRLPDEPLPDLSKMIPADILNQLKDYTSPLGTYFDAFPIHFVTTSWLEELEAQNPETRFEAQRFRPNFLIKSSEKGFVEEAWCGRTIRIGSAELKCEVPTVRCSMTIQKTGDLPKDPKVLRTVVSHSGQNVGAYARVSKEGSVEVGDSVELL